RARPTLSEEALARVKKVRSLNHAEWRAHYLVTEENLVAFGLWVKGSKLPRSPKNQVIRVTLENLSYTQSVKMKLKVPKVKALSKENPEALNKP
ncbi:hypothetical protein TorRG33x02_339320, partial [Trema orientale]